MPVAASLLRVALFVSGCLLLGLSAAACAEPEKIDLFAAGQDGFALYRIPGIVVTPDGTVLAYCEARKHTGGDYGEIEVHLRRSTDGGRTWEPARKVAHQGPRLEGLPRDVRGGESQQTVNNPVAIVDRQTGAIEFLYCVNYQRCFSMRSTDDGRSFSSPVEITDAFAPLRQQYDWQVIATGPGHGIQLRGGRLVVPIWLAYGDEGDHAPSATATIYSDDHGRTWHAGQVAVPDTAEQNDPNEAAVAELSDGRVLLVARNVSAANRKLLTVSPDGAGDWSPPRFADQLWEPICMAGLVAHPSRAGLLLLSNPHTLARDDSGHELPGKKGPREQVSIKLSRDDGRSWPVSKLLESGPSAYSDLAVLPDGTVLCFYERADKLSIARLSPEWLGIDIP